MFYRSKLNALLFTAALAVASVASLAAAADGANVNRPNTYAGWAKLAAQKGAPVRFKVHISYEASVEVLEGKDKGTYRSAPADKSITVHCDLVKTGRCPMRFSSFATRKGWESFNRLNTIIFEPPRPGTEAFEKLSHRLGHNRLLFVNAEGPMIPMGSQLGPKGAYKSQALVLKESRGHRLFAPESVYYADADLYAVGLRESAQDVPVTYWGPKSKVLSYKLTIQVSP